MFFTKNIVVVFLSRHNLPSMNEYQEKTYHFITRMKHDAKIIITKDTDEMFRDLFALLQTVSM